MIWSHMWSVEIVGSHSRHGSTGHAAGVGPSAGLTASFELVIAGACA